jgi:hypothetical protein
MKKIAILFSAAMLALIPVAAADAKPAPRHTDDGSGWGFCVGAVPPPGWVCP